MDFQELFNNLCMNVSLWQSGLITKEEKHRYIKGVFDTLRTLGLKEEYEQWCEANGILVVDDNELYA